MKTTSKKIKKNEDNLTKKIKKMKTTSKKKITKLANAFHEMN